LPGRSRRRPSPCYWLDSESKTMGETRSACFGEWRAAYLTEFARAMLARNHSESCLFARLVEQSRCPQWARVRFRADADSEMAKPSGASFWPTSAARSG